MGQAIADLPDPLETPQASTLGADDLLAQMAGEEIDRLLREADAEAPAIRPSPQAIEDASSPALAERAATIPPVEGPVPAAVSEADALAGELDSLLSSLTTANPPAPAPMSASDDSKLAVEGGEPAAMNVPAEAEVSSVESAALFSAPAEEAIAGQRTTPPTAEETTDAERSALSLDASPVESAALAGAPSPLEVAASAELIEPPAGLPRLLLPLEWMNAPLAACPDLLREFMGKAAILTVLNALALIFYVRFIRRH
jgi:hypothetical protein